MAEVVIMPKLGFNMDEGQLVKWHKSEGEKVTKGEELFEINTDKTTISVEATTDGVVLKILVQEGETKPVFTPIAIIGEKGEDPDEILSAYLKENEGALSDTEEQAEEVEEVTKSEEKEETKVEKLKLTHRARKYIKEHNIDINSIANIKGTGFQGGITERDIKASPLARKVSEKLGVDLAEVAGSGHKGKILKDDVIQAFESKAKSAGDKKIKEVLPYEGVRRIIGERLAESKFTAPHIYFTDKVDMTEFNSFREKLNAESEVKISSTDLLVFAVGKALKRFPSINSALVGDKIEIYESINIGIAVAGDKGLIVPVVKDIQTKTITEVAQLTKDLIDRARKGMLMTDEYSGGTFTISNLGMFGIGNFTAIINPPEAAILAVSSIKKRPVVKTNENGDDEIVIRPMMNIQLSVDHRLIDGLLASQFLNYVKDLLENPINILL